LRSKSKTFNLMCMSSGSSLVLFHIKKTRNLYHPICFSVQETNEYFQCLSNTTYVLFLSKQSETTQEINCRILQLIQPCTREFWQVLCFQGALAVVMQKDSNLGSVRSTISSSDTQEPSDFEAKRIKLSIHSPETGSASLLLFLTETL